MELKKIKGKHNGVADEPSILDYNCVEESTEFFLNIQVQEYYSNVTNMSPFPLGLKSSAQ